MMRKNQIYIVAGAAVIAVSATVFAMQRSGFQVFGLSSATPANAATLTTPDSVATEVAAKQVVPPATSAPNEVIMMANAVPAAAGPGDSTNSATLFPGMPVPPKEALSPEPLPSNGADLQTRMATTTPATEAAAPANGEVARNEFGLSCGPLMTGALQEAAMVAITLTAPCRADQEFTFRQGDMTFSATMNHLGTFVADVPALSENADFVAEFADGETAETSVDATTANSVRRVTLLSTKNSGLHIHALEFGAGYEDAGHVWSGTPGTVAGALMNGGGFLTRLGDDSIDGAQFAEVYTYPAGASTRDGVVRLSVETEVTALNCGKEVSGKTIQIGGDGAAAPVDLTLDMPDCDAIGEFLVLKNLLRDLKVASN